MTHNELKKKIEAANQAGNSACIAGKKCIPALDKNYCELMKEMPISKDGLKITKAWISGWSQANLTAQDGE